MTACSECGGILVYSARQLGTLCGPCRRKTSGLVALLLIVDATLLGDDLIILSCYGPFHSEPVHMYAREGEQRGCTKCGQWMK